MVDLKQVFSDAGADIYGCTGKLILDEESYDYDFSPEALSKDSILELFY